MKYKTKNKIVFLLIILYLGIIIINSVIRKEGFKTYSLRNYFKKDGSENDKCLNVSSTNELIMSDCNSEMPIWNPIPISTDNTNMNLYLLKDINKNTCLSLADDNNKLIMNDCYYTDRDQNYKKKIWGPRQIGEKSIFNIVNSFLGNTKCLNIDCNDRTKVIMTDCSYNYRDCPSIFNNSDSDSNNNSASDSNSLWGNGIYWDSLFKSEPAQIAPTESTSTKPIATTSEQIAPTSEQIAPTSAQIAPTSEQIAPTSEQIAPTSEQIAPTSTKPIAPEPAPAPTKALALALASAPAPAPANDVCNKHFKNWNQVSLQNIKCKGKDKVSCWGQLGKGWFNRCIVGFDDYTCCVRTPNPKYKAKTLSNININEDMKT